jgi:hypothetical protein
VIKGLSLGHQIDLLSHLVVDQCDIKHIKFIMMKNCGVIILILRLRIPDYQIINWQQDNGL